MKKFITFNILLLICWILLIGKEIQSEVTPPNYNFRLEDLDIFDIGTPLSKIKEKYGNGELLTQSNGNQVYKYFIHHLHYKFPILVQISKEEVSDYFCHLPSYFLHDIFLNSLVKKYGKQNRYRLKNEEAIYLWEKGDKKIVYMASCTITCFPVYLSVTKKSEEGKKDQSLLQSMIE